MLPETTEISENLKLDLINRINNLKENIAESCEAIKDFNLLKSSNEEINAVLDHIFSNYGEHIVEKSKLNPKIKKKYINSFLEHQVAFNDFFQIEDLYKMEKEIEDYFWNSDLESIDKWNKIDSKLSLYEEFLECYCAIAC